MEESVLLKIAEQNILLKPPIPYDIFLNTRNYFILYYPFKEQKAAMLLVIKKKKIQAISLKNNLLIFFNHNVNTTSKKLEKFL